MANTQAERTEGNVDELVLGYSQLSSDGRHVFDTLFFAEIPLRVADLQSRLTQDLDVEKEDINVRQGVQELREKGFVPERGQITLTPDAQSAAKILYQAS